MSSSPALSAALDTFAKYRAARLALLRQLDRPASNREPLAEFSEHLVALLMDGVAVAHSTQPACDVIAHGGVCVQVRHLANPADQEVNNHRHLRFREDVDAHAVVVFEALTPTLVLIFPRRSLAEVCRRLGKRHPHQSTQLHLTRRNVRAIVADARQFQDLGVQVVPLTGLR